MDGGRGFVLFCFLFFFLYVYMCNQPIMIWIYALHLISLDHLAGWRLSCMVKTLNVRCSIWYYTCHAYRLQWPHPMIKSKDTKIKGNNCCFSLLIVSNFDAGMCLGTKDSVCFKLCMMIDASELYIFIPVWVTMTFIQDHRGTRKLKLVKFLAKFLRDFD